MDGSDQGSRNVSKTLRNAVEIDRNTGRVTKRYLSGTSEERLRRMLQERDALLNVPQLCSHFRTPPVLNSSDVPVPTLVIGYMDHAGSLASRLKEGRATDCRSFISSVLTGIHQLHKATLIGICPPNDLIHRIEKYGSRYSTIVGDNTFRALVNLVRGIGGVSVSSITHQDLKLSNVLIGLDGECILIDWEHCSQGSCVYDTATLFTNLVANLAMDVRLGEISDLVNEFTIDHDQWLAFSLSVAARALVEIGPAMARREFGDPDKAVAFFQKLVCVAKEEATDAGSIGRLVERLQAL